MPSWGTTGGAAGEWYWWRLRGGEGYGPTGCGGKLGGAMGTCKPNPAYEEFHNKTFGADFKYSEFGPMFTAELFDPEAWAALFAASGIKYVVLTSKHHEGWTNWCSKEAWNWNACDNGPHRDLVGELSQSVRAAGMHMGLYHSIFEFYHPLYLEDKANNFTTSRYVDEVYIPQSKELNQLYKPDLIWSDGDWEANSSCALFASAALPSSVPVAEKRELMQVLTRAVCTQTGNQQSSSHGCTTTPQTVTRWWSTIDGALSAL